MAWWGFAKREQFFARNSATQRPVVVGCRSHELRLLVYIINFLIMFLPPGGESREPIERRAEFSSQT